MKTKTVDLDEVNKKFADGYKPQFPDKEYLSKITHINASDEFLKDEKSLGMLSKMCEKAFHMGPEKPQHPATPPENKQRSKTGL